MNTMDQQKPAEENVVVPPSATGMKKIERALRTGDTDTLFDYIGLWLRKNRRRMTYNMAHKWEDRELMGAPDEYGTLEHVPDALLCDDYFINALYDRHRRHRRLGTCMEALAAFSEDPDVAVVLARWKKTCPKRLYETAELEKVSPEVLYDRTDALVIFTERFLAFCTKLIPEGDKTEQRYHELDYQRGYLLKERPILIKRYNHRVPGADVPFTD